MPNGEREARICRLLDRILAWNRMRDRAIARALAPGVGEGELAHIEGRLGRSISGDARAFFKWRNGLILVDAPIRELQLVPNYFPISIEQSIQERDLGVEVADWERGWLPIFSSGSGDFVLLDESAGDRAIVLELEHAGEPRALGASLEWYLESVLDELEAEA